MTSPAESTSENASFQRLIDAFIRVGLIFLLVSWCFDIIRPFAMPVLWGIILAVALYPVFHWLERMLGGRSKSAAVVFALFGVALLVVPSYFFFASLIEGSAGVLKQLGAGTLEIPPPGDSVKDWPLIGERLHAQWLAASTDLDATFEKFGPRIKELVASAAKLLAGLGMDVLQFVISTLIAAVFLATASSGSRVFGVISRRLVGERGDEFAKLTTDTIRNVAKGVVGVAVIQTLLCGIGIFVAGIPAGGLWILLILILAVIQLPPLIILLPIIIYQFTAVETVPAVIFTVWSLIAGGSDTFLKPIFLGRGMKTPMLVILIGAIGGMIWSGMIGLFIGAVVLSLTYELFTAWLHSEEAGEEPVPTAEEAAG